MAETVLVELSCMDYAGYFPDFESLLRYSLSSFLYHDSATDPHPQLTEFRSLFSRVLAAYSYSPPPLEAVWFFSALKHRGAPDNLRSVLDLLSVYAEECRPSASPAAANPLALLAPVVFGLIRSEMPRAMVEALVDAALGYVTRICGSSSPDGGDVNADAGRLLPVFPELVEMWIQRGTSGISCPFEVLFPLAGEDARRELMREGCSVNFLAGVVVAEAFLLSLCLKVQDVPRADLITWAVTSIQGFNNKHFLGELINDARDEGVLLNMLVNPPLPVHPSLSADDEILVRDVLYDALILSDYSVLSGAEVHRADSSLFPIFVSRLAVTFDAISDARHKGDHERAESYINAFSTSNIPSYLTKWASLQAGTDHLYKPIDVTPQAFMKWLVDLEDKGLKVSGEKSSRIMKRLMQDEGQNDNLSMISQSDDDLFFIDKQSHQEGLDTKGGTNEASSNCIKECIQSIAQCFPFHHSQ